jgi:hypothetical protein
MNFYKLDNKETDDDFLARKTVRCKAVVKVAALDSLQTGNAIVIQLSNRSKYKGKIIAFHYQLANNLADGFLEIVRA